VDDLEDLCLGLSHKVWQKASLVERYAGPPQAFLALAGDTGAPDKARSWNRYYAGGQLSQAGDRDGARAEWEGVVAEYKDSQDSNVKGAVDSARRALEGLDKSK
jgi:hypothetical protein